MTSSAKSNYYYLKSLLVHLHKSDSLVDASYNKSIKQSSFTILCCNNWKQAFVSKIHVWLSPVYIVITVYYKYLVVSDVKFQGVFLASKWLRPQTINRQLISTGMIYGHKQLISHWIWYIYLSCFLFYTCTANTYHILLF